jgi:hypothetical protein
MTVVAFAAMAAYATYAETSTGSIVSQLLVSSVFATTGLAAWARRPENRPGPLMVAFGWTFMAIVFTKPVVAIGRKAGHSCMGLSRGPRRRAALLRDRASTGSFQTAS